MRRATRVTIMTAGLLASAMTASAAQDRASLTIMGAGAKSCGSWTEARQGGRASAAGWIGYTQWVSGYIVASNIWTAAALGFGSQPPPEGFDLLDGLDNDAIAAWVDNYCREHPLDPVAVAAKHLVDDLTGRYFAAHPSALRARQKQ